MRDAIGPESSQDEVTLESDPDLIAGVRGMSTTANAAMVNRARRVVRERAKILKERRSKIRSLWLPVAIFSSLLIGVSMAVWTVLEEYELFAGGSQVASYQVLVPFLWSIPVSAALLAVIWFQKSRADVTR